MLLPGRHADLTIRIDPATKTINYKTHIFFVLLYIYQWLQHLVSNWSTPIDYLIFAKSTNLLFSFSLHIYSNIIYMFMCIYMYVYVCVTHVSLLLFLLFYVSLQKCNFMITQLFI